MFNITYIKVHKLIKEKYINYNELIKETKLIIASVAQWSKRYFEAIDMGVQFSPGAKQNK